MASMQGIRRSRCCAALAHTPQRQYKGSFLGTWSVAHRCHLLLYPTPPSPAQPTCSLRRAGDSCSPTRCRSRASFS